MQSIGVPSMQGMKSAFGDFAVGALGGLLFSLSKSFLGNGLLGAIAAPVLTGSIIKGPRGTALATVAGFMLFANGGFGGGSSSTASTQTATTDRGVM